MPPHLRYLFLQSGASITLEPGGQLELSGAPVSTLHETMEELKGHLDEVSRYLPIFLGIQLGLLHFGFIRLTVHCLSALSPGFFLFCISLCNLGWIWIKVTKLNNLILLMGEDLLGVFFTRQHARALLLLGHPQRLSGRGTRSPLKVAVQSSLCKVRFLRS
jgi:hypothetical protein